MLTRTVDSLKYYLWHQDSSTVNIDITPPPPPPKKKTQNKITFFLKRNRTDFETKEHNLHQLEGLKGEITNTSTSKTSENSE